MSYFTELKVKHIDHKFIFVPLILFTVLTVGLYLGFGIEITYVVSIPIFLLIVLTTIFHVYRAIFEEIRYQNIRQQAITNIHSLIKPALPLPTLAGWAAFPGLINAILNEVSISRPNHIAEIGSGSSTIITSYLLKKLGSGKITSFDHDAKYAAITAQQLDNHQLSEFATIHTAPLTSQRIDGQSFKWYDLNGVTISEKIDVLVVDGPPEKTQKYARFPALPVIYEHLAEHAIVILDDAGRKEEREIVQRWLKKYPEFEHQYIDTEKGISILRR